MSRPANAALSGGLSRIADVTPDQGTVFLVRVRGDGFRFGTSRDNTIPETRNRHLPRID